MDTAISSKKQKVTKTDLFSFAVSFALSLSPVTAGVYPFGLALLISSTRNRLFLLLGGLLAVFFTGQGIVVPVFALVFVYFAMKAYEKDKPCPLFFRLVLAVSCSIFLGAKIVIQGLEVFDDGLKLVFTVVSIPVFTFLFDVYNSYSEKKSEAYPKSLYDFSLMAFAFAATKFFGIFSAWDAPFSLFAGAVITLAAARYKGFLFGGVCGFVCGIACNVPAIAALGIIGITYGMLESNSAFLAALLSFMLSITGYAYLSDFKPAYVPGAMLLAAFLIFIPIVKKFPKAQNTYVASSLPNSKDIRLKKFAAAFSSLSGVFFTMSDTVQAESITEINRRVRKTTAMFCERCNGCTADQEDICNQMTTLLKSRGVVTSESLPAHFRQQCPHCEKIVRAVNRVALLKDEECESGLKSLAEEYNSFSSLLNNAARIQEDNTAEDKILANNIKDLLLENKVTCDRVKVTGKRRKTIEVYGVKPDKMGIASNRLTSVLSEATRTKLSMPEFLINENYVIMRFMTLPRLHIEYAKTTLAKNGEPVCGDTVSFFENEEKYFYCLLSDGMGSGRDAALTSRLSAIMLEKLLTIGADKQDALQMVNKALTQKKEEIFATIDLLEVDEITSQATLFKVGAAPTFLVRDGECHRIEAKTPPAGIMREVIAEKITITLRKGDYIVMVSDGVVQTGSDLCAIEPIIKSGGYRNANSLAAKIVEEVKTNSGCSDDISVCSMRFY